MYPTSLFICQCLHESTTGQSRCFPFWQDLLACYVVNTTADDVSGGKKCLPALDDYYECLHHKKEVSLLPNHSQSSISPKATVALVVVYPRDGGTGILKLLSYIHLRKDVAEFGHQTGCSSQSPSGRLPQIRSHAPKRTHASCGNDTESGNFGEGGGYEKGA